MGSACHSLGLSTAGPDPAPDPVQLADPELLIQLRPLVQASPLGVEAAALESQWLLGACLLLLHDRLAPPLLPPVLGDQPSAVVLTAALELAQRVPGFAHAAPSLTRLAN